jgi:ABC-type transport system substrate-binding protein
MVTVLATACLSGCSDSAWNNPYPDSQDRANILYSAFTARPKHLDPVRSYSSDEYLFIGQIYEPPLQYHYLKRPYQLEPLTADGMPTATYLDRQGRVVTEDRAAFTRYTIRIRKGIRYQPHPALAVDEKGKPRYLGLKRQAIAGKRKLSDFKYQGTRELVAADYIYQIKRMAHPRLQSPIYSLMADYIVGLKEYSQQLRKIDRKLVAGQGPDAWLDLTRYPLKGVRQIDRYTYTILIKGRYPQFLYWLAMPFFAPVPPEAERFYMQPGMKANNLTLDWYPIGTGAYMLTVNDPNRQMVLERNPNYHDDHYPTSGSPGDRKKGLLTDAGKRIPFIDKAIYSLEKETIPYWNKFLQGYYDASAISSDNFDQAVQFNATGDARLTPLMRAKGIRLVTAVQATTIYMGFNMKDPVVGGYSERARKLRQAISIAIDYEEYISIFANGRGVAAQSPIPPGIFGYRKGRKGINPVVYRWVNGRAQRRSIADAKRLLAEAGYPGGRDARTGKPLLIHLDVTGGGPGDKATWDWLRKQFLKIDLELDIRNTDYNRFREKMRKGNAQLFTWGWNADYPDPENFLFLLYGPNGKVDHGGENVANYNSPEFNRLFEKMKNMSNSPERLRIIERMLAILHHDAPWLFGFHPRSFTLFHRWFRNVYPNLMAHNTLKYRRIDPQQRFGDRRAWNQPVMWPVWVLILVFIATLIPAVVAWRRREHKPMKEAC